MDEALLITACRKGDARAQRQLFEAHASALLPVCLRYMNGLIDAEDMLLRAFQQFYHTIDRFEYRGEGSTRAYLKRLAVRECLMGLRRQRRLESLDEVDTSGMDTDGAALSNMGAKELFRMIAALPDGYRTVFNLYEVEGYTHPQIAVALGISVGTSKSQLSKAKALLRQQLQKEGMSYAKR